MCVCMLMYTFLDERWYVESRNVVVRINGTSGNDEAVMINAHYGKYILKGKEKVRVNNLSKFFNRQCAH